MIARGYPKDVERKNDKLIQLFIDFLSQNQKATSYFNEMRIPEITGEMIEECIDKTGFPVDREYIKSFIINEEQQIRAGSHRSLTTRKNDKVGMWYE